MKAKILAFGLAFMALALTACDDTTDGIGGTLTDQTDKLNVQADNILSRATDGFLGKLKDPETQSDVTANLMSQLYVLPNYQMPEQSIVTSKDPNGKIIADSCELRLYYYSHYGDSLAPIKITTYELEKPAEEGRQNYSNFDPQAEGYIRTAANNGLEVSTTYTLTELAVPDSVKKDKNHKPNIHR